MKKEIQERIESIKNNQLPKSYRRVKDIGIAPEDWTIGKMSDVIENVSRPVPKPNEPYWRLGIKSWAKGTFHAFVDDPETVNMDELYEVKENDLIVNITFAWEHAIAIAKKEDDGLLVSHRFPTYVFKEGQVPEYYQAVITQRYFKDMLVHISPGGAGRNRVLNRKDFLNLPCFIPSTKEQKKISEILTTCERLIELKQQLLEEKRRQKQWLLYAIFFEQRIIPKTINEFLFKEIFSTHSCRNHQIKTEQYLQKGKHPVIDQGKCPVVAFSDDDSKLFECPKTGLIVFGDHTRELKFVSYDFIVGADGVQLISAKEPILNTEFGYYLLSAKKLPNDGYSRHFKYLKEYTYSIPDRETQNKISSILRKTDNEIILLEREFDWWTKKKKSLMQLMLTGLVRTEY